MSTCRARQSSNRQRWMPPYLLLALRAIALYLFAGVSSGVSRRLAAGYVAHTGRGWRRDVGLLRRGPRHWECHSCVCEYQ